MEDEIEYKRLYHDDMIRMREFFERYSGSSAVLEAAVGWMWLVDELESFGIDVHLAHSSGVSLIAGSRLKTGEVDAKASVIVAHQIAEIIYKLLSEKRSYNPRPKRRKNNSEVSSNAPIVS